MKTGRIFWTFPALSCTVLALVGASAGHAADNESVQPDWNRRAAARYLDSREVWWQSWNPAQKEHGTQCVSCHTQASYELARPILRQELGEQGPAGAERVMLAGIEYRVRQWNQMQPFYGDVPFGTGKATESRDAEAVLNAFILASHDAGQSHMSETTRLAFDNAWALQSKAGPDAGAWVWLNFGYAPWESKESQYHWAALMAMAIGKIPDHYRDEPKVAANISALAGYLRSHYDLQPLLNQIVAQWAAVSFPGLLDPSARAKLLDTLDRLQHPDGGWSLADLGPWARVDKTPLESRSDGYATGLIVLVMEEAGAPADVHVARGIQWLQAQQDKKSGAWPAWSLNKDRDPKSDAGLFMSDAATSYAVLALERSQNRIADATKP